ncbi:MAG TPA: hypothetical protein ENO14_05445, partial [Chromatiales bacterium]|nr:hypothetical protein [Chromatiales bacterium]
MVRTDRSTANLLAEALVIVVSILLAFGLDAMWDQRNDRQAEAGLRASLAREFQGNREILAETMAGIRQSRSRIEAFAVMASEQVLSLPDDSAWVYLDDLS